MITTGQVILLGVMVFALTWSSEMIVRVIWAYVSKRQAEKKVEQMKEALTQFKENEEN